MTGVQGLGELRAGRGFLDSIDSGLDSMRELYQRRFENAAAKSHYVAAFIDYVGLELVIPRDGGDLGVELAMAMIPGDELARLLNKRAADLIRGSLRRSKSYRSELEDLTYGQIIELSRGKDAQAKAARQMKKLIEQTPRLQPKAKGKPR